MGNSTSKVSARAEPYLQRTSQSEAENEMWEWNFGECMCDTNEPRNVASKTGRNTVWKLVSRVSSNSASSDSSSSQSDARNLHTGTTLRPLRLIQSPSTTGYTKVTAADRGEPLSASPLQSQPDIPFTVSINHCSNVYLCSPTYHASQKLFFQQHTSIMTQKQQRNTRTN